ncbi:hypothetical protein LCL95_05845 [Bacillus timonensis]|nr:hypothetical protein [Bacillus timonensis]
MKKSEWNDEQLEQLFKQMPSIKDQRSPQDIYQNISSKVKKKKKYTWVFPSLATAAALFIFFIIAPSILNNQESNLSLGQDSSEEGFTQDMKKSEMKDEEVAEKGIAPADQAQENSFAMNEEIQTSFVAWDAPNQQILTYGVPDENAEFIIPVSIIVEERHDINFLERMQETLADLNKTIDRTVTGLSYSPLWKATFSQGDISDTVTINVPRDFYLSSSTEEEMFKQSIEETFRWNLFENALLYTDGQSGIEMGNTGKVKEIAITPQNKRFYLLYTKEGVNQKYLVPIKMAGVKTAVTFEDAFFSMYNDFEYPSVTLKRTIPKGVTIENIVVENKNRHVTIVFTQDSVLENDEQNILMVESIMLTAKEFGFDTVTFIGNINQIGEIQFNVPMIVPFSPNPIQLQ